MPIDPELESLGTELTQLGNTVVPHGDHLCVRLPFFASLRVRLRDGVLRCEQRFGMASREISVFSTTGMLAVLSAAFFLMGGPRAGAFGLASLSLVSAVFDILRAIVTEAAMTRVQLLWAVRHTSASVRPHQPASQLGEGTPDAPIVGSRFPERVTTPH